MSYIAIEDFRLGIDRRRQRVAGVPGSLWKLVNAHITRGGDIERAKKFVSKYTLPSGTFGLGAVDGQIFVFGSVADPGVPAGVKYQRLQHSDSSTAMSRVIDVETFDGKFYVIAEFADGSIFHYYDGSRVTDWDTRAGDIGSLETVAAALAAKIDLQDEYIATASGAIVTITAAVAGTGYTISKSTTDGGGTNDQDITLNETQANQTEIEEVLAEGSFRITGGSSNPGTNQITDVTVDGVDVLGSAVDWADSHSDFAAALAAQINSHTSSPDYSASSNGTVVTITAAPGSGSTPNGFTVAVTTAGDVTVADINDMSGGVDAQSAAAQINEATLSGTYEVEDIFTITLDGTDYTVVAGASATGKTALTFRQKVYSVVSTLLWFSKLNDASVWDSMATGSGFINMGNQIQGGEDLTGAGEYQGKMAIFSRNSVRIWSIVEDDDVNEFIETVRNTGTSAPKSILPYGNLDVFYLSDTGIRSLRPRDSSGTANVEDVGTAIDELVQEWMDTLSAEKVGRALAVLEPRDGRYWLVIGSRIFVFSFYPSNKIKAWSYYEPGFEISDIARINDRIYARADDTIYLYGGDDRSTYPDDGEQTVTVEFPFLDAKDPAGFKNWLGFDIALTNDWDIDLLVDPNDENNKVEVGVVNNITYPLGRVMAEFETTHVAPKLTCSAAGNAKISNMAIHYMDKHEAG